MCEEYIDNADTEEVTAEQQQERKLNELEESTEIIDRGDPGDAR